jgi:hypothetical protein
MGEKRRFHEVDFSESLRKTLYEQKEQIKQILEEREVVRTRNLLNICHS